MTKQNGFTLFELLIATFILTFGLLGIAGINIQSLKRTKESYYRTIAISQLVLWKEQFSDYDGCLNCNENAEKLLPHGKCICDSGKTEICWKIKHQDQCIDL